MKHSRRHLMALLLVAGLAGCTNPFCDRHRGAVGYDADDDQTDLGRLFKQEGLYEKIERPEAPAEPGCVREHGDDGSVSPYPVDETSAPAGESGSPCPLCDN